MNFSEFLNEGSMLIKKLDNIKIYWNNSIDHNLIQRISERCNIRFGLLKNKFSNIFQSFINMNLPSGIYVLEMKASKFKMIILWNLSSKKIKVNTILAYNMKTKPEDKVVELNEIKEFFDLEFNNENGIYLETLLIEENLGKFNCFIINDFVEKNIILLEI